MNAILFNNNIGIVYSYWYFLWSTVTAKKGRVLIEQIQKFNVENKF